MLSLKAIVSLPTTQTESSYFKNFPPPCHVWVCQVESGMVCAEGDLTPAVTCHCQQAHTSFPEMIVDHTSGSQSVLSDIDCSDVQESLYDADCMG